MPVPPPPRKRSGGRPTLKAAAGLADAILDASWRLFLEGGYRNLNMDRIAREASVSKRTLYDRFGSREGLFEALVTRASDRWSVQAQAVYRAESRPDWLRALIAHMLDLMGGPEFLALTSFMIMEGRAYPQVMVLQSEMSERSLTALAEHLASRVARYPADNQGRLLARSVMAVISGWARIQAQSGAPVDAAIADRVTKEVRSVLELHGCEPEDRNGGQSTKALSPPPAAQKPA